MSTSTSALEHTKKLELLKSAGFIFNSTNKKLSVAEQFNAAAIRLDLTRDAVYCRLIIIRCEGVEYTRGSHK